MTWRPEWNALSARVAGLVEAGKFCLQCFSSGASDPFGALKNEILPRSEDVFSALRDFVTRHQLFLPVGAVKAFTRFVERSSSYFRRESAENAGSDRALNLVQLRLTALAAIEAEISFQLADASAIAKRLSDRAFSHLRRSIVADHIFRVRWQEAFSRGEVECERLGAIHLLLHGIWAFKVGDSGERTDLVMGDRLDNVAEAERAADALVLTEWKIVRPKDVAETKAREAYGQVRRYGASILAGLELADYRYIVLVSKTRIDLPPDFEEDGVRYCHINIAVEPETPSREGRRQGKSA